MKLPKEMYVVIVERDMSLEDAKKYEHKLEGPMVWETYLTPKYASLEAAKIRKLNLGNKYGEVKIAKLTIID